MTNYNFMQLQNNHRYTTTITTTKNVCGAILVESTFLELLK